LLAKLPIFAKLAVNEAMTGFAVVMYDKAMIGVIPMVGFNLLSLALFGGEL
jgi:hypothetical protein